MKYFVIKQDERITDRPYPKDFYEKINVRHVAANTSELIQPRTLIHLNPSKHTVFPDILCTPVLLVTREMLDVIELFNDNIVYRQIVYLDTEHKLVQLYFMPLLDIVDCLSGKCEYVNESRTEFSKVVLKSASIEDKSLFQTKNKAQRIFIIRLDLVESLLVRGCKGFTLMETEIEA